MTRTALLNVCLFANDSEVIVLKSCQTILVKDIIQKS